MRRRRSGDDLLIVGLISDRLIDAGSDAARYSMLRLGPSAFGWAIMTRRPALARLNA